jgi:cyclomaltodextrinase
MKYLLAFFIVLIAISKSISQMVSLVSPLQLQHQQTVIVKADYFPFGVTNLRMILPMGLSLVSETEEEYIVAGQPARPFDNIRFESIEETKDIPCKASQKVSITAVIDLAKATQKISIKGSFNSWQVDSVLLKPIGKLPAKNWLLTGISANEGYMQYKLIIDSKEIDPINTTIVSNGAGGTNAILKVGNPDALPPFAYTQSFDEKAINIKSTNASHYIAYWNNQLLAKNRIPHSGNIFIQLPEKAKSLLGRSFIRVYVSNKDKAGNDILIPLQNGKVIATSSSINRNDLHSQIMYFMMVDRFANGDQTNDPKPLLGVLAKAQYLGGDLAGIQQKIATGFFNQLGTNTIWLSPISQNPIGAWGLWNNQVTTKFSAYHGYWPTSYSLVDFRLGTNKLFSTVISTAHQQNTNIILDFVAHHVHTDHPLYQKHPDWVTPLYLPDGTMNTERWDDYRLTTWFDTFLPTLNFDKKEVREVVADSVLFWVKNFEIDGFRHDASKHVPSVFWRSLTQKIKIERRDKPNSTFFQIGETYGSSELINSYVNTGQMDAQFDFNVYDASVSAFIHNGNDSTQALQWENLKRTLTESFAYYGSHHLMGNISGNQDRPRFASLADGSLNTNEDTKLAGWTRDIQNANEKGFLRMAQLMAFNMTLPGVPVIYYGDEYAMPGGNDPDNRRMMQFTGYNTNQLELIDKVKTLTALRKNNMALLYGEYQHIETEKQFFAFQRSYFNQKVITVFSKKVGRVTLPKKEGVTYKSVFGQSYTSLENEIQVDMKADDVAIFITE